ncbi:MAG: GNAT family N-acetyltransferase [Patescibacteria group bacterium]|nr:GNAT family N-acetyltransferase [Patescibacteria group bacterium]
MPRIDCLRRVAIKRTARVKQLEGMFDVPPAERSESRWQVNLPLEERPWSIGLIVGPSGCGKSTLARELFGDALLASSRFEWPADKSIVDAFPAKMSIKEITGLLSAVGFSSPPSWLRPFAALSNGEQFRVTTARALAESPDLAVIDEFTSVVDRTVAQIASCAVGKAVRRTNRRFVGVACHYDIIDWLDPDWTFDPSANAFAWRSLRGRPEIDLEISRVEGTIWRLFSPHHYLAASLCETARCFAAFVAGRPAAFASVMHTPHANGGYWREHRTVCLPDFQGAGIGNALSEYVAAVFAATGKPYNSTTSHPGMIAHRGRSPLWRMTRRPGFTRVPTLKQFRKSAASSRFTASFRYVGPPNPQAAYRLGIAGPRTGSTDPCMQAARRALADLPSTSTPAR